MIPGLYEFRLDAGHMIFLGVFYTVVMTLFGLGARSAFRAWRDLAGGRVETIRWSEEFHALPASSRACRHQLTGEAPGRICERGFDCRACAEHRVFVERGATARRFARDIAIAPGGDRASARARLDRADDDPSFAASRPNPYAERMRIDSPEPQSGPASVHGFEMPADRFYHRGHTWIRPERDGSVSVGLDDFASRLVGAPDRIELPSRGSRLVVGGAGVRLWKKGIDYRVASPVDGEVVAVGGQGAGFVLRVRPTGCRLDTTHLLRGAEVDAWILRELEGLERALGPRGSVSLADGGVPVADLSAVLPEESRAEVVGGALLDL